MSSTTSDMPLEFHVISQNSRVPTGTTNRAYLSRDRWDDWGEYCTQFWLTVVDSDGMEHAVGNIKIGEAGLKPHHSGANLPEGHRSPSLSKKFYSLDESQFSLGQDDSYYENLSTLGDEIRKNVLTALRDVAFDLEIWKKFQSEEVVGQSLLRMVKRANVEGQYHRMAHGGARLTSYFFSFTPPKRLGAGQPPYQLDFEVTPASIPPTNIHVLIGRNGVGKTHLLNLMTKSIVAPRATAKQSGNFEWDTSDSGGHFTNIVTVSFSAFDDTELFTAENIDTENGIQHTYIGLRNNNPESKVFGKPKNTKVLSQEFVTGLQECQSVTRKSRWLDSITFLESDLVFHSAGVSNFIDMDMQDEEIRKEAISLFGKLSSGHKLVLLTLTKLVEAVEEKTLVLLDEPEAHLHPPLLSAFIRALSHLLINRNGVAIVATHSPVVLQEVPKTCVWVLRRVGRMSTAERPEIETFGENVGVLTREVFQLELTQSGFHKMLQEAIMTQGSYEGALELFKGQLGAEARAVLRGIALTQETEE